MTEELQPGGKQEIPEWLQDLAAELTPEELMGFQVGVYQFLEPNKDQLETIERFAPGFAVALIEAIKRGLHDPKIRPEFLRQREVGGSQEWLRNQVLTACREALVPAILIGLGRHNSSPKR